MISESYFLKYKKFFRATVPEAFEISVSWSIKNFYRISASRNVRKAFLWENIIFYGASVSWNMWSFLILELESSIFLEYKKFSQGRFVFIFWAWDEITGNVRKAFFWENIGNLLILKSEIFISWKVRNLFGVVFWTWVESAPGSCILYYFYEPLTLLSDQNQASVWDILPYCTLLF